MPPRRPPGPRLGLAALLCRAPGLCLALLAGCGRAAPAPAPPVPEGATAPAFAPGTALTVNGEPLAAREIEELARTIAELYPAYARLHTRRLALTAELLPRLAGRALAPEAWSAARAACTEFDPHTSPAAVLALRGNFDTLGLGPWSAARHLEPGAWSGPLEFFGRFVRLCLVAREPAEDPRTEVLELALVEFPYLEHGRARAALEEALDRAELVIVDPTWREAVPEAWQHRMRPDRP